MTNRELFNALFYAASGVYDEREARSVALFIAEKLFGTGRAAIIADPDREIRTRGLEAILTDISTGRPAQYIAGSCEFCGMEFAVAEGVLIPRNETEELVEWVAAESTADMTVLDVGTGSGAIAVALAKKLANSMIYAIDISQDALAAARRNAEMNGVRVTFAQYDILAQNDILAADDRFPWPEVRFDVIVSNPPYVPASDRASMHLNVTGFEPHEALFVPDDDQLVFYRAIAATGRRSLKPDGRIYFEIYEHAAEEVSTMLAGMGYGCIEVRKDINGRDRMVKAVKI